MLALQRSLGLTVRPIRPIILCHKAVSVSSRTRRRSPLRRTFQRNRCPQLWSRWQQLKGSNKKGVRMTEGRQRLAVYSDSRWGSEPPYSGAKKWRLFCSSRQVFTWLLMVSGATGTQGNKTWSAVLESSWLKCSIVHQTVATWADLDEAVVLNEDGVTGEVAMDDGRFAGVQVAAEVRQMFGQLLCIKATPEVWILFHAKSPESWQDLCTPAFPSLLETTGSHVMYTWDFLEVLVSYVCALAPSHSWSCGFSLSSLRIVWDFRKTCTQWWKWPAGGKRKCEQNQNKVAA